MPGRGRVELSLVSCRLRPLRRGDEESLTLQANNRKVWLNLRDPFPHPYTRADAEQWIKATAAEGLPSHLAVEVGGEVVGGIGLRFEPDRATRTAEVGFWLGEPFWGRGIMTESVRAFTEYAFATFGLRRIFARVFEWNPASMRVLEKSGYAREDRLPKSVTKDGKTIDEMLFAMTRD